MEEFRKVLRDLKNELEREEKTMTPAQLVALVDALIRDTYDYEDTLILPEEDHRG